MGIDEKYLLDLLLKIRADMQFHWGFHTTVVIGVSGWLITSKEELAVAAKKALSLGYLVFYLLINYMFVKLYWEYLGAIENIRLHMKGEKFCEFLEANSSIKTTCDPNNISNYKPAILEPNFITHLLTLDVAAYIFTTLLITTLIGGSIIYLIWHRPGEKDITNQASGTP